MPIDQTITAFPAAPNAGSDTPEEFSNKADAFVAHQSDNYVGEVNTWATEANATASDVNDDAATSGTNATNAAASAVLANEWAENPEDVPVVAGEYSALHWAAKAQTLTTYEALTDVNVSGLLNGDVMQWNNSQSEWQTVSDFGIETVTNADGKAIKFPDGTLICYSETTSGSVNTASSNAFGTTAGQVYFGYGSWTFPVAFIESPTVSCTGHQTDSIRSVTLNAPASTTEVNAFIFCLTSHTSVSLSWIAVGRWK